MIAKPYLDPRRARTALLAILTGAALLLGVGQASAQLKAPGEVRWFVDATTNVIVNSTSFASVPIPTGHTAVLKSVVDAACSCASRMRGLWDGTTYTLPASLKTQTADEGRLKAAARVLHQRLAELAEGLDRVSVFWPAADVAAGHMTCLPTRAVASEASCSRPPGRRGRKSPLWRKWRTARRT